MLERPDKEEEMVGQTGSKEGKWKGRPVVAPFVERDAGTGCLSPCPYLFLDI